MLQGDIDCSSLTDICAGIEILLLQKGITVPNWDSYSPRELGLIMAGREQEEMDKVKVQAQLDWIKTQTIKDALYEIVYDIMPSPKGQTKKPYPTKDFFDFYGAIFTDEYSKEKKAEKLRQEEEKKRKIDQANINTRLAYMMQIKAQQEARKKAQETNDKDKTDE